jgi:hypothetical protein
VYMILPLLKRNIKWLRFSCYSKHAVGNLLDTCFVACKMDFVPFTCEVEGASEASEKLPMTLNKKLNNN